MTSSDHPGDLGEWSPKTLAHISDERARQSPRPQGRGMPSGASSGDHQCLYMGGVIITTSPCFWSPGRMPAEGGWRPGADGGQDGRIRRRAPHHQPSPDGLVVFARSRHIPPKSTSRLVGRSNPAARLGRIRRCRFIGAGDLARGAKCRKRLASTETGRKFTCHAAKRARLSHAAFWRPAESQSTSACQRASWGILENPSLLHLLEGGSEWEAGLR